MVKVKICGITNLADAKAAQDAGCDALGFVFYKKSPRYIAPEEAREIIAGLGGGVIKIGVFFNAKEAAIRRIAKLCRLNMLQFHGDESPEFCLRFKDYKVIKGFRIKNSFDLQRALRYKTFAYLFDTFVSREPGGTGKRFNWKLLTNLDNISKPVFLSGGLNARNVQGAVKMVRPEWVDASSSLETRPGKKDHNKTRKFIRSVKLI